MAQSLFMVCTEASGDLLGARLLAQLKTMIPQLSVTGVAGDMLAAEGMQPLYRVADFNVMGLVEVFSQLRRLKRIFNELVEHVRTSKPDVILLVDAPDFNLRFAKAVRSLGIPIVYYVSPQVWAWRKKRAARIADLVDHMMVLFSFEQSIYQAYGLTTTWVGHPLVDELGNLEDRQSCFARWGLDPEKPLIALAPGSRGSEVGKLLPTMAQVAERCADRYQFAVPLAPTIDPVHAATALGGVDVPILPGEMRAVMKHARAAVVASGTATLETGLLGTPMIVGYRLKRLTYAMANMLVKVPHVALVNIVLGKRVVPELIQDEFTPEKVIPLLDELASDGLRRSQVLAEFARLEQVLGGTGAARRAAEVVKGFLSS